MVGFPYKSNRIFGRKDLSLFVFENLLRASDYLGLYIRLTVIGALALYFLSFGLGQIFFALLFLYLTAFQLLPLWNHHQNKLWVDLYPVAEKHKKAAFQLLLTFIIGLQTLIFALIVLLKGEWMISLFVLLAGLLFSFLFVKVYSTARLK